LVILTPYRVDDLAAQVEGLLAHIPELVKPVFACVMGPGAIQDQGRRLQAAGVPVFNTPEAAVNAHASLAIFHQNQQLLLQVPGPLSELEQPDVAAARAILDHERGSLVGPAPRVLSEADTKALLQAFGIPVLATRLAHDPDQAVAVASEIGYPVCMKLCAPDAADLCDEDRAALDLRNPEEVRRQYDRLVQVLRETHPDAPWNGVTVQAMCASTQARSLYIGVFRDSRWGPVIALGAGGTHRRMRPEVTLEFAPLNRFLAQQMIERSPVWPSLGAISDARATELLAAVDLKSLERVLLRVSEIVCELPEVVELDINPLRVDAQGTIVTDARLVMAASTEGSTRYAHLCIEPYPARYEQAHLSSAGRPYRIRPIVPEDTQALQRFMRGLSPQARYFRFVSTLSELPPRMLVRFAQIDYAREVALAAVASRGHADSSEKPSEDSVAEEIVAVVRYMLNPDRRSCEFAVVVADAWQGQGLGSTLMRAIVAIARERGLAEVEGYVLRTNRPMLGLMQHLGFRIRTDPQDPEMCRVLMPLN
jgi:acetyltransferase